MKGTYREELAKALSERSRQPQFAIWWAVAITALYVVAFLTLAVLGGTEDRPHQYFREGKAVDLMSSAFLFMAFAYGLACSILYSGSRLWGRLFWILLGLGCLFLSVDELLKFHEQWGTWIRRTEIGPTETFRNWNDVIVIVYGLLALVMAALFLPEILRYPRFANVAALGFLFYVLHTLIDATQSGTPVSRMWEESMKLFAVAFFAVAVLGALVEMARARKQNE